MVNVIDETEVRRIARLARLSLSTAEVSQFSTELGRIVSYVSQLSAVNCDGVWPMAHPIPLQDVTRSDQPLPPLPNDAALANAPDTVAGFFKVPAVFESAGG